MITQEKIQKLFIYFFFGGGGVGVGVGEGGINRQSFQTSCQLQDKVQEYRLA